MRSRKRSFFGNHLSCNQAAISFNRRRRGLQVEVMRGAAHDTEPSMYTRILVAVDGSHTSRRAFDAALDLASSLGATLRAFYAVENTPMYFDAPGYDPSVLRNRLVEQGKELGTGFEQAMRERGVTADLAVVEA